MTDTITTEAGTPPPEPAEPVTVVLSAGDLAYAWQSVTRACATMEDRPILKGLQVDVHGPDTVRITATDSYQLLTSVIGRGTHIDDLDATPDSTWIIDPMSSITDRVMTEILRTYRPDTVTLTFTNDDVEMQAKLAIGNLHLRLPLIKVEYPPWRKLVREAKAAKPLDGTVTLGHLTLPTLAALASESKQIELKVSGALSPILMRVRCNDGWPPISGLIMPVRLT